jgi:hypothetical protein
VVLRLCTVTKFVLLTLVLATSPFVAQFQAQENNIAPLEMLQVQEPHGQILSYRYLSGSTEVLMRGTRRAPDARIKLKIGSRPGFVELDINRGQITGLKPASQFGRDFLTYVLWAVSVDGKASNLGEITFEESRPISINVTTPYQTFWLMLTAEPSYAVVDPSPVVVLYSTAENSREPPEKVALTIPGNMYYYTHYAAYDMKPTGKNSAPNALLQARKAVELASKSDIFANKRSSGPEVFEEKRTREALKQARAFLERAEQAYKENPNGSDVTQFSRTAAQIAENARALAQGAVGGALVTQLQNEVEQLRNQLTAREMERAISDARSRFLESPPMAEPQSGVVEFISKPFMWFSVAGWLLALLLLFRRRTV